MKLVYALTAVHNYIREHNPPDEAAWLGPHDESAAETRQDESFVTSSTRESTTEMDGRRDRIAMAMWNDYKAYTA